MQLLKGRILRHAAIPAAAVELIQNIVLAGALLSAEARTVAKQRRRIVNQLIGERAGQLLNHGSRVAAGRQITLSLY